MNEKIFDFKSDKKFDSIFTKLKLPKKTMIIFFVLFLLLSYYFILPAFNLRSVEFWAYLLIVLAVASVTIGPVIKKTKLFLASIAVIFVIFAVLNIFSLEIFNAKKYANILEIKEGNFSENIKEMPYKDIPTIDRDTAIRLGSRKMGELLNLVSQFNVNEAYTQINLKNKPVRVTPLEYNGLLKWLTNHRTGIPNYMVVNMIDGSTELVKPSSPIKYSNSDIFFRDIFRHTRLSYPTKIFGETSFEIADDGTPYWITSTMAPRIGWFGAMDVEGAILVNALDGTSSYYKKEEVPTWVDRLYAAEAINSQLIWHGKFQSGYFNSLFAQKGVLKPTKGYNYLALNDDVYLYTGFTSVAADQSNVGFVLVNLRTKETTFYPVSSAEEFSAMESAEGEVQEKGYKATFPLLLNIKSKPTYFLSLKDNAGLIKTYAFIDAQNYQDVSIGNTVEAAYKTHLGQSIAEIDDDIKQEDIKEFSGKITDIKEVVVSGNSHFYMLLENEGAVYVTNIKLSSYLPFKKVGDKISGKYIEKGDYKEVVEIK